MIWADVYQQHLDPLQRWNIPGSWLGSTLLAAVPVLVLFWLLVRAPLAGAEGRRPPPPSPPTLIAVIVYGMRWDMATMAFVSGAGFGLLPVGWTIFNAMLRLQHHGADRAHSTWSRRSVAGLSGDARIQAVLIGFAFGAFLEGAAGAGSPVAICGAIMIGLGFDPFLAAVLCLIANTSPVAYGGLGTPLITLSGVTDLPTPDAQRHGRASAAAHVVVHPAVHGQVHVFVAEDVRGLAGPARGRRLVRRLPVRLRHHAPVRRRCSTR